ncbi:UDP-3-O-(3-hydroxymyristoyl)glucosamine N-acyltransferase [Calothrix sp. PCC 6303]|uniref:UDP-3-O-(3-hydroxymyristoyl)glucosamine N-acyltransferase n=1 Tax=Calothrix sp. PCC 6303 TaxID=1170562 RepID=UPI0002A04626|nr:UDP-3-O-(3-hydroxymyristoyl)glucosamine N-acyltransferase [Calothrix sp. PCC 6303]AFZ04432.1 UDP-3-O-(3-hydroxymyristoyl) glucosamine N-acyltransferase [Calothrix sp. PCC 6303]
MKFSEIVEKLGDAATTTSWNANNDCNPEISGLAAVDQATSNHLSYIEGAKFASFVAKTNAGALILPADEALQAKATQLNIAWLSAPEPKLLFAQAIRLFYKPWQPLPGIHPTAVIHPTAKVGNNVYIGAHAVIEERVEIGDGACIHANVVIYPDVQIGDSTILHANCSIHERTRIGNNCTIHSGAVIGAEGFGFVPTRSGWEKMEQSGYTVLEDNVEVGCNSAIDRPAVGETRIGKSTIIDNMVQVGHGCQVGFGCAFAGQSGIAGGAKIGNRVILAGQSGVSNQVKIGDGAIASAKAGIHTNVAAGQTVSGMPAMPHKQYLRISVILNHLPEMYQVFKKLQGKFGKD